ncbi:hypothetical protein RchiOBHm_Chr6g0260271 [Rosa chinensis]|uniref:Uncharacterized protein n=1 Tax=Rosa chinensis TaxID=74649 RepID=A0A2P6PN33_ROSCH|nr:hypothetical protein RchiOBHm_Chr6g0260271 [Rosa chinensis]
MADGVDHNAKKHRATASEPFRSWSSKPSFTSLKKIPRSTKTSQTPTPSSTALSRRSPLTMSSLPRTPASTPGPTGEIWIVLG